MYNRTKSASRQQELADRKDEIAAIDNGTWPRDMDDEYRWGALRSFHDMAEKAAYARSLCTLDVEYLEGIPARIATGELLGWEP